VRESPSHVTSSTLVPVSSVVGPSREEAGRVRHPVSSLRRCEGGSGAVAAEVVRGAVLPTPPEHAHPGSSEDANSVGMVAAAPERALVDGGGPGRGVAGVVGKGGECRAQALVAGPAERDAVM